MANPWDVSGGGGGTKSASKGKQKKPGLIKKALLDLREIVTHPKEVGRALAREVAETAQMISPVAVATAKLPIVKKIIGPEPLETPGKQMTEGIRKGELGKVLQAPGVRLVPGTYVGSRLAEGKAEELSEHPLFAALDVLPYVNKASRIATVATRPGRVLASRAATRADLLGQTAKVERIGGKGLGIHQTVGELARSAEDALVAKRVLPATAAPTHLLEMSGLGGGQLRRFMSTLGIASREAQGEATKVVNETVGEAYRRGLGPTPKAARDRALQISQMGQEGRPGWKAMLNEKESGWLQWYETKTGALADKWVAEGKLIKVGGEVYSATDTAAKSLRMGLRNAAVVAEGLSLAKARGGMFDGRTTAQWAGEYKSRLARVEQLKDRAVPTPFKPLVEQRVRQAAANLARDSADGIPAGTDIDTVVSHIVGGDYQAAGAALPKTAVTALRQETKAVWRELKEQGYDPIYLHHVTSREARKLINPRLDPTKIIRPSFTKPLTWNMRSWQPDMEIGLTAQGVEHVHNLGARRLKTTLQEQGALLTQEQALAETRRMVDAGWIKKNVDEAFEEMYDAWDPASPFPVRVAKMTAAPSVGTVYIPKALGRALRQTMKGSDPGFWGKAARTPMGVFRLSILGLAPMYYAGNLVSGALMLAAHNPAALLEWRSMYRMVKEGRVPKGLSVGAKQGSAEAAEQTRRGGEAFNELRRRLNAQEGIGVATRVGEEAARLPRWLNRVASGIDDMYKTMAFLGGEKQALRQGMSKAAAHQAGLELAHKVLVNFDRMTPLERTAIRTVIPFVSWQSHILRYVMSYPFDHPWRAAIVTASARIKQDEWPEDLPLKFKNDLFFDSGTKRFGMTNFLPWQAVPDLLSREGFLSRLNPMIQTLIEYTGADPYTYSAPVFGPKQTRVNPVSGREEAVPPRLLPKVIELSPQVRYLWGRLTKDPEWLQLAEENPEAARAAAFRAFGISIPRTLDVAEEVRKHKKALTKVAKKEGAEAAASGSGGWDVSK